MIDIRDIMKKLDAFSKLRNWHQFHTPKDLAISISVEAAELLELFQWQNSHHQLNGDEKKAIKSEIADVLQYVLLLCNQLEIDPLESIEEKIKINELRFPVDKAYGVAKPKV